MFTQASQQRIAQRQPDGGIRIVPAVSLQSSPSAGTWNDADAYFEVVGNTLTSQGGVVEFRWAATRTSIAGDDIYRLVFTDREDTITTPQLVGELAVIKTSGADRTWAVYSLVGTPEGTLEPIDPYSKSWQTQSAGDVLQFTGTWFI